MGAEELLLSDPAARVAEGQFGESSMRINLGPAHPVTHGTVRFVMELEGETVRDCDVQIGYLHRGMEKECERVSWLQVFPYTDRLNYVSPLLNNIGYALAVEKLCGILTKHGLVQSMARIRDARAER